MTQVHTDFSCSSATSQPGLPPLKMTQKSVRRIAIWTHARSISTTLSQCLAGRDDTICFHEPFGVPYFAGAEDILVNPKFVELGQSYTKVKKMLEKNYEGKAVVAFKDMASYMYGKFNHIPQGFTYVFLIREPIRSIHSLAGVKNARNTNGKQWLTFLQWDNKGLYRLYQYVTEVLKQEPIIIDAYDLSHHPEKILKILCRKVDIPYTESMLTWRPRNMDGWHNHWKENKLREQLFRAALDSTCFRPLPDKDELMDASILSHEDKIVLEKSTHVYEILYKMRIKPTDCDEIFKSSKL
ncbi:uncharacterized protein LOC100369254 [Saccoglossus kowalevskii]|uniref:Branched-chain-amino-acid aminotransferase-like protein 1-like n=1 Tax=Saccoglossus kowalevskii TaxID=10224 RepID=A0ABM0H1I7_SACKO|nr:PREDICTED: branched-chain-amino-acid aminotransferase-like protein 1-like [Saccoglossus kowalevskii]